MNAKRLKKGIDMKIKALISLDKNDLETLVKTDDISGTVTHIALLMRELSKLPTNTSLEDCLKKKTDVEEKLEEKKALIGAQQEELTSLSNQEKIAKQATKEVKAKISVKIKEIKSKIKEARSQYDTLKREFNGLVKESETLEKTHEYAVKIKSCLHGLNFFLQSKLDTEQPSESDLNLYAGILLKEFFYGKPATVCDPAYIPTQILKSFWRAEETFSDLAKNGERDQILAFFESAVRAFKIPEVKLVMQENERSLRPVFKVNDKSNDYSFFVEPNVLCKLLAQFEDDPNLQDFLQVAIDTTDDFFHEGINSKKAYSDRTYWYDLMRHFSLPLRTQLALWPYADIGFLYDLMMRMPGQESIIWTGYDVFTVVPQSTVQEVTLRQVASRTHSRYTRYSETLHLPFQHGFLAELLVRFDEVQSIKLPEIYFDRRRKYLKESTVSINGSSSVMMKNILTREGLHHQVPMALFEILSCHDQNLTQDKQGKYHLPSFFRKILVAIVENLPLILEKIAQNSDAYMATEETKQETIKICKTAFEILKRYHYRETLLTDKQIDACRTKIAEFEAISELFTQTMDDDIATDDKIYPATEMSVGKNPVPGRSAVQIDSSFLKSEYFVAELSEQGEEELQTVLKNYTIPNLLDTIKIVSQQVMRRQNELTELEALPAEIEERLMVLEAEINTEKEKIIQQEAIMANGATEAGKTAASKVIETSKQQIEKSQKEKDDLRKKQESTSEQIKTLSKQIAQQESLLTVTQAELQEKIVPISETDKNVITTYIANQFCMQAEPDWVFNIPASIFAQINFTSFIDQVFDRKKIDKSSLRKTLNARRQKIIDIFGRLFEESEDHRKILEQQDSLWNLFTEDHLLIGHSMIEKRRFKTSDQQCPRCFTRDTMLQLMKHPAFYARIMQGNFNPLTNNVTDTVFYMRSYLELTLPVKEDWQYSALLPYSAKAIMTGMLSTKYMQVTKATRDVDLHGYLEEEYRSLYPVSWRDQEQWLWSHYSRFTNPNDSEIKTLQIERQPLFWEKDAAAEFYNIHLPTRYYFLIHYMYLLDPMTKAVRPHQDASDYIKKIMQFELLDPMLALDLLSILAYYDDNKEEESGELNVPFQTIFNAVIANWQVIVENLLKNPEIIANNTVQLSNTIDKLIQISSLNEDNRLMIQFMIDRIAEQHFEEEVVSTLKSRFKASCETMELEEDQKFKQEYEAFLESPDKPEDRKLQQVLQAKSHIESASELPQYGLGQMIVRPLAEPRTPQPPEPSAPNLDIFSAAELLNMLPIEKIPSDIMETLRNKIAQLEDAAGKGVAAHNMAIVDRGKTEALESALAKERKQREFYEQRYHELRESSDIGFFSRKLPRSASHSGIEELSMMRARETFPHATSGN